MKSKLCVCGNQLDSLIQETLILFILLEVKRSKAIGQP